MTGWQVWGWTVVLLGPPALFGAAVAFESWRDHWRRRRAVRIVEVERETAALRAAVHPGWGQQ